MPEKITAQFRIVTPMFIGDAEQQASGISPSSVKGALRFWWRALNWGRFRSPEAADDVSALRLLHAEEARLFGGLPETVKNTQTGEDETQGGQGVFLLRVVHGSHAHTDKSVTHPKFKDYPSARYLGYGLMVAYDSRIQGKSAGQLERACLNENQNFTVELLFRQAVEPSVQNALVAWGLLGGLGSRSRHGMGSVALEALLRNGSAQWTAPSDVNSYDKLIKELILPAPTGTSTDLAPFTAFGNQSRIDRLLTAKNCYEALDAFGKAMLMYRSWGLTSQGNKLPGGISEKRFKDDHDWFRDPVWAKKNPNFHPQRVVFGLPHNYHQNHHHVSPENHERRASPLLFHVHPVGTGFLGISIYLPAQFLPAGEGIKGDGTVVAAGVKWSVITDFLDGTPTAGTPARFPHKMAVLP